MVTPVEIVTEKEKDKKSGRMVTKTKFRTESAYLIFSPARWHSPDPLSLKTVKAYKRTENIVIKSKTEDGLFKKLPLRVYEAFKDLPEHYEVHKPDPQPTACEESEPAGDDKPEPPAAEEPNDEA